MFGGIIVVVVHYAGYAAARKEGRAFFVSHLCRSRCIDGADVGLAWKLHVFNQSHGVVKVEAIVIVLFALFWVAQSVDLWKRDKAPALPLSELLKELGTEEHGAAEEIRKGSPRRRQETVKAASKPLNWAFHGSGRRNPADP